MKPMWAIDNLASLDLVGRDLQEALYLRLQVTNLVATAPGFVVQYRGGATGAWYVIWAVNVERLDGCTATALPYRRAP